MSSPPTKISRIAVGVDGFPEGRDAAALGAAISRATGAEVMLVAIHPEPLVVLPEGLNWTGLHKQARDTLREVRDSLAPGARIDVETDLSVPRGLRRVVRRDHRDLLVLGSSRHAAAGHLRIGKRTRQLLCHFECALAIAPRGLHTRSEYSIARIGVGYDGSPEAQAALALAGSIGAASGAELVVCGVVDDRIRTVGFAQIGTGPVVVTRLGRSERVGEELAPEWEELVEASESSMRGELDHVARTAGASVHTEVQRGRPADALLELGSKVDLLVIGSRRWGPVARVMLGSTGEALMHAAGCPVLVVPRPHAE
jgi:nucleotide-binding universal stress UspA family protein